MYVRFRVDHKTFPVFISLYRLSFVMPFRYQMDTHKTHKTPQVTEEIDSSEKSPSVGGLTLGVSVVLFYYTRASVPCKFSYRFFSGGKTKKTRKKGYAASVRHRPIPPSPVVRPFFSSFKSRMRTKTKSKAGQGCQSTNKVHLFT